MDQIIDIDPGPENLSQNVTSNNTLKTERKAVKKNNYFPGVILQRHNKVDTVKEKMKKVKEKKFSLFTLVIVIKTRLVVLPYFPTI